MVVDTGVVGDLHLCCLRCAYVTLPCEIFDCYVNVFHDSTCYLGQTQGDCVELSF
jgi:hypothetical protein